MTSFAEDGSQRSLECGCGFGDSIGAAPGHEAVGPDEQRTLAPHPMRGGWIVTGELDAEPVDVQRDRNGTGDMVRSLRPRLPVAPDEQHEALPVQVDRGARRTVLDHGDVRCSRAWLTRELRRHQWPGVVVGSDHGGRPVLISIPDSRVVNEGLGRAGMSHTGSEPGEGLAHGERAGRVPLRVIRVEQRRSRMTV